MKKINKLLIIDGYGFVFRAYHINPPLLSPSGEPVGAIYGFTSMLIKIRSDFKDIEHAVIVFDSGSKNFRHDIYPLYKANRAKVPEELLIQLPIIRTVAQSLNFPSIERENVEADDIIASLVNKAVAENIETIIVSSDKDLMQLIGPSVKMYDPLKAKYIDRDYVINKFGVPPEKVRDILALMGDASDNIPGVAGVGPKTAALLLDKYHTLNGILENKDNIENPRYKKLINDSEEAAKISWLLVGLNQTLTLDYEWDAFRLIDPDIEKISKFLHYYHFKSLVKRVESLFNLKINPFVEEEQPIEETKLIEVKTSSQFNELYVLIKEYGVIGVYLLLIENISPVFYISINNNCYKILLTVPFLESTNYSLFVEEKISPNENFLPEIIALINDPAIKKITYNLKGLMNYFSNFNENLDVTGFEDLELMEYCISAGLPQKKLFDFNLKKTTAEEVILNTGKVVVQFEEKYNELIAKLYNEKAFVLYKDIDLPLCSVLHTMEKTGIKIDLIRLKKLSEEFGKEIKTLEEAIFVMAGEEFNIASVKQLGEILFNKLKLPFGKHSTKSAGFSTGAEILEKLSRSGYEIADLLLNWRALTKLKSTYTDSLPQFALGVEQRIHSCFLQTVTTTSRLSSQEPNLQNIPIRSEEGHKIRGMFIARKNCKFIAADYSQIELRILAHIANIDSLKEAFLHKRDIHTDTAKRIFELEESSLTLEHRRKAKAINFGIIYGISPFGLAKQLNISNEDANNYIKKYFIQYPGIKEYMDNKAVEAEEFGYVKNLLGRKCYVPLIHEKKHTLKQVAIRAAINAPIQGTNAEIIKIAMINIDKLLKDKKLNSKLILQIHDELLFEVPDDEITIMLPLIRNTMENAYNLTIPLLVDIKLGDNWQELHNVL